VRKGKRVLGLSLVALVIFLAGGSLGFAQTTDPADPCAKTWDLWAGQHIDVGSVTVTNDTQNIYVTYQLDYPGATFGNLHMWVGTSLLNLPGGGTGRPAPGQLCNALGGACFDATGLTSYTFTIPFASLSIVDVTLVCDLKLYVVTHAEVVMDSDGDGNLDNETAFGGDKPGPGPAWWFYAEYPICCNFGPPPPCGYETVFAKGTHVWTTDPKSNPDGLPSLRLIRNRWGWAINLLTPGVTTYQIWAGAGLNNTANGHLVGTLTVTWDGNLVTVKYEMLGDYLLQEVHLYAGDLKPTTTAPGQYGLLDSFEPLGVKTYSFTSIPLSDTNGDGVWLIAHGVAGIPCAGY
jgi:hypothetical protein